MGRGLWARNLYEMRRTLEFGAVLLALLLAGCTAPPSKRRAGNLWDIGYLNSLPPPLDPEPVEPLLHSESFPHMVGDVAIWGHPSDPNQSLVIATDLSRKGAILVFDTEGKPVQTLDGIAMPYGVEVQTQFNFGRRDIDIVATIERETNRLRIFGINPTKRKLWEISGDTKLFSENFPPDTSAQGLALYRSQTDKRTYAFVSRKRNNDEGGIILQYELVAKDGRISLKFIRDFGDFSHRGIVKVLLADDYLGYLYYVDRSAGIRKYSAEPHLYGVNHELAQFGAAGWRDYPTGLALWNSRVVGKGYIMSVEKLIDRTALRTFKREGEVDEPNRHTIEGIYRTISSSDISGIDICLLPMKMFPEGLIVVANQNSSTLDYYSWRSIRSQNLSVKQRQTLRDNSVNWDSNSAPTNESGSGAKAPRSEESGEGTNSDELTRNSIQ